MLEIKVDDRIFTMFLENTPRGKKFAVVPEDLDRIKKPAELDMLQ